MPANVQQYVLLPVRGLRSSAMAELGRPAHVASFQQALGVQVGIVGGPAARAIAGAPARRPGMKILHSSHEDGPKLAELSPEGLLALRQSAPGVRAVPVVFYDKALLPPLSIEAKATAKKAAVALQLKFVDQASKKAVKGAFVVAFTDFANRLGVQGTTDASGKVSLAFAVAKKTLDVLLVYGPSGYWGLYRKGATIKNGEVIGLQAVDVTVADYLAKLYGGLPATSGTGVTVGVIDTGVDAKHPDLSVAGGRAFVQAEGDAGGFGPAKVEGEHGTHVAGIISSHGKAPTGKRGVAPGVKLLAYRVFPNDGTGAANYDIVRAIDQGVTDGCDLLNLSLGGRSPDPAVHEAIKAAFDQGTLCIVASGNDDRKSVSFPARWSESIAVSAVGDKTTFPKQSTEAMDVMAPFATTDKNVFLADFSNVGPDIDFTGPGVGIVSTVPGGAYAVMSGTSMACPAVTGIAAALLAKSPAILALPRDRDRSIAMQGLMSNAAKPLGLGKDNEGSGLMT